MSKIDFPEDGWSGNVEVGFRDRTPRGVGVRRCCPVSFKGWMPSLQSAATNERLDNIKQLQILRSVCLTWKNCICSHCFAQRWFSLERVVQQRGCSPLPETDINNNTAEPPPRLLHTHTQGSEMLSDELIHYTPLLTTGQHSGAAVHDAGCSSTPLQSKDCDSKLPIAVIVSVHACLRWWTGGMFAVYPASPPMSAGIGSSLCDPA